MTETRESEGIAPAIEELTAAVRLLRTHLAAEREESALRRRREGIRPDRLLLSLLPLMLLLGVALGLAGGAFFQSRFARAAAKPKEFSLSITTPEDLGSVVSESVEGETYRLSYVTRDRSKRKTLLFHARGGGLPYGKVVVPLPSAPAEAGR